MAKQRYIDTHFWDDGYIENLKPMERYLFMYFLTNPHTNICGIYELSFKKMVGETSLSELKIRAALEKFATGDEKGGRIYYIDGWVFVKNFIRHQAVNPNVTLGIKNKIKELPKEILNKINEIKPIDSLYIDTELLEPEPRLTPKQTLTRKPLREDDPSFKKFWKIYRRKVAKDKATTAWKKVPVSEHEKIYADVERKNSSKSWTENGGQFIPNPTTYINQRRWEDQVDLPSTAAPPKRICRRCNGDQDTGWMQGDGGWIHISCAVKSPEGLRKLGQMKSEVFKSNLTPKTK